MKNRSQLLFSCIALLTVMLLFNAGLFYSTRCSVDYLQTKSVWNQYDSVKFSDYRRQKQLLATLPTDSEQSISAIQAIQNLLLLSPKKLDKELEKSPYAGYIQSMNLTAADSQNLTAVKECIYNAENYRLFVMGISENADNISSVLYPLSGNEWTIKNAARCEKDYYGMEHITIPALLDMSISILVQYHVTDFLCFILLLLLSFFFYLYLKKRMETAAPDFWPDTLMMGFLGIAGILLMYLSNLWIADRYIGIPEYSIPLQAIKIFYVCPFPLSLGSFLILWISVKVITLTLLLFLCLLGFSGKHRYIHLTLLTGLLVSEFYCSTYSGEESLRILLREINVFSGFTCERFFNRYLNLNLGGHLVSRSTLFPLLFILLYILICYFSLHRFKRFQDHTRQTLQQAYFDEIDKRYQETRRLWHDFNNHLLAVKALYSTGNTAEAEKYIDELSDHGREFLLPVKTGSNVVDLLLFRKYQQAQEQSATLSFTIGCNLKNCGIADYDLCSLLGNLLDNAMEACTNQEGSCEISLRMEEQNSLLFLSCQNPFQGDRQEQNGLFPTTKNDSFNHGIGLQSVKQICRKYRGSMDIQCQNQIFTVTVLLNKTK